MHQPWINEGIIRCEESIPWLVAGVVLAAILPEILVVNKLLHSRFGNDAPAVSAAVKAALLGLFSPFSASTGGSLPIAISLAHMKCSCVAVTTFVMVGQAGGFDSFILSLGFVGIPTGTLSIILFHLLLISNSFIWSFGSIIHWCLWWSCGVHS